MKKLTTEEFILRAKQIHNNKYDYSKSIYLSSKDKIEIICPLHGSFWQNSHSHLNNKGCSLCYKSTRGQSKKEKSKQSFVKNASKIHHDFYDYSLSNYENAYKKVAIRCPIHGLFYQSPNAHINNKNGCRKCRYIKSAKSNTYTTKEFIDKANQKHNNKYIYTKTNYINTDLKVVIICKIHGDFLQTPHGHLSGKGCPKCKSSHGEGKITQILQRYNIEYETQKTFINCKNKLPLRFDFYIPKYNLVIEYNGQQHYTLTGFSNAQKRLIDIKKNDIIKKIFCYKYKINLLIIPFQKYNNIELIIKELLNL
jgi:hypothetical protein